MDTTRLKNDMMKLWKDTFHDSDDYINLIFDTYFNPDRVEYIYKDGKLVSSLLTIPYKFIYISENKISNQEIKSINEYSNHDITALHGLYLCGLQTRKEYQSRGLMSMLIEKINKRAFREKYQFTFLIPSNISIINYYNKNYFSVMSYVYNESILNSKDKRYDSDVYVEINNSKIINTRDYIGINNISFNKHNYDFTIKKIKEYIDNNLPEKFLSVQKDDVDIRSIISENFISAGKSYICINDEDIIQGLLFASFNDVGDCIVQLLIADSSAVRKSMIKRLISELDTNTNIYLRHPNAPKGEKIYSPYSVSDVINSSAQGLIADFPDVYNPFGALAPFSLGRICKLADVLKFATACAPGRKYSILVTDDPEPRNRGFYEVINRDVKFTPLDKLSADDIACLKSQVSHELNCYHLSSCELASILWRQPKSKIIEDTLAIPALPVNISLMLE